MGNPTCTIDDCGRPLRARGACDIHYQRARKAGTLDELPGRPDGRSNSKHRLSDIDEEARTATCATCGAVRIKRRSNTGKWGCQVSRKGKWVPSPEARKRSSVRQKYRIAHEEYVLMLEAQAGKCLICQSPGKLVIDHDHITGEVRGLLCHRCNVALGWMNDSVVNLTRAAKYLRRRAA